MDHQTVGSPNRSMRLASVCIENGFTHDDYSDFYTMDAESDCCTGNMEYRCDELPRDFIDAGEIRTTVYLDAEFRLSR